jgi:hypothetical protein
MSHLNLHAIPLKREPWVPLPGPQETLAKRYSGPWNAAHRCLMKMKNGEQCSQFYEQSYGMPVPAYFEWTLI